MEDDERGGLYSPEHIQRCMRCEGDIAATGREGTSGDPAEAACLLCERYFGKGRLFLNNIG